MPWLVCSFPPFPKSVVRQNCHSLRGGAGGAVYSRVGTMLGAPSIRPVSWGAGGAKCCICWCQVWASQPRKESPNHASPPPPAPAAVDGRDLECGRADPKALLKSAQVLPFAQLASGKGRRVAVPSLVFSHVSGLCRGSRSQESGPVDVPHEEQPGRPARLAPAPWQGVEVLMLSVTTALVCKHPRETVPQLCGTVVGVGTCLQALLLTV